MTQNHHLIEARRYMDQRCAQIDAVLDNEFLLETRRLVEQFGVDATGILLTKLSLLLQTDPTVVAEMLARMAIRHVTGEDT